MQMKKITIEIETTNDAFSFILEEELSRILKKLANDIAQQKEPLKLLDINGNKVGQVSYDYDWK